jgi:hypothetical protein
MTNTVLSEIEIIEIHDGARRLESLFEQAIRAAAVWMDIAADGSTVWEHGTDTVAPVDAAEQEFYEFLQAHRDVLAPEPRWRDYFAIEADLAGDAR